MADGRVILIVGALLGAAVLLSLVAGRARVPAMLAFLLLAMAIGSDGLGWVYFDDYRLASDIGIVALVLIIAEGGLTSGFDRVRPVLGPAIGLATLGTLLTAVVAGLGAALVFEFSLLESMLLGSIVASTDAAAIFGILRTSTLEGRLSRTLEGEASLNDPVAILLVFGFIEWLQDPAYGALEMAGGLVSKLALGALVGAVLAVVAVQTFRRVRLATPGLYPVASLSAIGVAYGVGEALGGSGFVAVYLVALGMGSAQIPARRLVIGFHEGLAWVAQIALFFTLGLLVFPGALPGVALEGVALAAILALIARPAAVFATTLPFRFSTRQRLVLAWAGLRGAIPVVLATFAVLAGTEHSLEFFNIVFFTVLLSTLIQGPTFESLARRLGATTTEPALPRPLAEAGTIRGLGAEVVEYTVAADDAIAGHRVRDLGLPRDALVTVIVRGASAVPPRGSTRLEPGDELHVLVRQEAAQAMEAAIRRWHRGPIGPPPRPRRRYRSATPILTVRPWTAADGDPHMPAELAGIAVVERLRSRSDRPGGLFVLADGRYGVSGPVLVVGSARQVGEHARRRLRARLGALERSWWQEVIGALAAERAALGE